jgi:altronate hydrolase
MIALQLGRKKMNFVRLDRADNVVTATRALEVGVVIEDVQTTALIPSGHKIAPAAIA